ncbi:CapA family protein [Clostridioides difficile]
MKNKLAYICIISILLFVVGCSNNSNNENNIKKDSNNNQNQVEEQKKEPIKKDITISFAGDVTMGNYKGSSYYGSFNHEFERQGKDYDYFLKNVKPIFEKDDLTVVNLEGPLTDASEAKEKKFAFKGKPEYVNILKSGNVEAVSVANNHSEDYFEEGMKDTKFILDENKINYFGLGKDAVIDVNGIKVGLLGYNGLSTEYNEKNLNQMEEDIKALKEKSDVVMVYFHWGIELEYSPDKKQKDFAHYVIDKGADLVIGSHPHVVQGIEKYKEKYIAYSLGNFCFGGNKNPSDTDSYIYQQTFTFSDNKLSSIKEPNIIPTAITSSSSRNNYQPKVLDGSEKDRVLNKLEKISKDLNT